MIKCVVFDLDDTLYSEASYAISGFKAVDGHVEERFARRGFFEKARDLFDQGLHKNLFNIVLKSMEVKFSDEDIHSMVHVYRHHTPDISLYEDAQWALNYCKNRYQTGLITDGYKSTQTRKIKALDLNKRIDHIVVTDELGADFWKPHPKSYADIESRSGCAGEMCMYIGDNEGKDFVTARERGWKTVCIRRDAGVYRDIDVPEGYRAEAVVKSLYELEQYWCR